MGQRLIDCLRALLARRRARRQRDDLALELDELRRHLRAGRGATVARGRASRLVLPLAVSGASLASALMLVAQPIGS